MTSQSHFVEPFKQLWLVVLEYIFLMAAVYCCFNRLEVKLALMLDLPPSMQP